MVFKKSASQNDAKVVQKEVAIWMKIVVAVPKVYYL